MNNKEREKVLAQWSQSYDGTELNIYSFPPARDYFFNTVNGTSGVYAEENWSEDWFIGSYLKDMIPVKECLSLCCGHGQRDRRLAKMGVFKHCLGLDINGAAVESAKQDASRGGYTFIDYKVSDLNNDRLEQATYDLVYVGGGMHHILNLEHLVDEIYSSLKPGGYLVCDEYVGPAYNDLSDRHREIINSAIHLLPQRLRNATEDTFIPNYWRTSLFRSAIFFLTRLGKINFDMYKVSPSWPVHKKLAFQLGKKLNRFFQKEENLKRSFRYGQVFDVCPANIKRGDPSEGPRADEIVPVIKKRFKETKVHFYNGSVIAYALDNKSFANYNPSSQEDRAIIDLLLNIDKTMIEVGEIPSIHAIIVSQKV